MADWTGDVFTQPAWKNGPQDSHPGTLSYYVPTGSGATYINQGYYAAGATFEAWTTHGAPGTSPNPNTGHAVTDIEYVVES